MSDYRYDVFISYRRGSGGESLLTPWIAEVVRRTSFWLAENLGGVEARVFFDKVPEVNGPWPDTLRQAIKTSRCLLPIWTPSYFRSLWCLSEWQSFVVRERMIGPSASLIVPVTAHDGQWFPREAQRVVALDLRDYTSTVAAFWDTRRADELELKLQHLAARLTEVVRSAPPYRDDWPVVSPDSRAPNLPTHLPMREL